jgi:hypothetical protein
MEHYIDRSNGEVLAYEDGTRDEDKRPGIEPLSDEELAEIRAAQAAANAPTPEQILREANARRDELLVLAGLRIAPLQDAVDLDEATSTEIASLKLWKQYRVAVNRVPDQAGFPTSVIWPSVPA